MVRSLKHRELHVDLRALQKEIGCDYPGPPALYNDGFGNYSCRCIICGRCGHHTGNTSQGHFWRLCLVTRKFEAFHMCCENNCELHNNDGTRKVVENKECT